MDALVRERLDTAAHLLRSHAALIMYAASRREDLATARMRLTRMLATGWTESANPATPKFKTIPERREDTDLSGLSDDYGHLDGLGPSDEHSLSEGHGPLEAHGPSDAPSDSDAPGSSAPNRV